jgi:hypothetical protein
LDEAAGRPFVPPKDPDTDPESYANRIRAALRKAREDAKRETLDIALARLRERADALNERGRETDNIDDKNHLYATAGGVERAISALRQPLFLPTAAADSATPPSSTSTTPPPGGAGPSGSG